MMNLIHGDCLEEMKNINETVLDFTMGSGSTGCAAKNLNRKFIGIEKDATYFQKEVTALYEAEVSKAKITKKEIKTKAPKRVDYSVASITTSIKTIEFKLVSQLRLDRVPQDELRAIHESIKRINQRLNKHFK